MSSRIVFVEFDCWRFYPTVICCSFVEQIYGSKCLSADVIFIITSTGLCQTAVWSLKCEQTWTMKDADVVISVYLCLYNVFVACPYTWMRLISPHLRDLMLSHVPFQDNLSCNHVSLPTSWHWYSPAPVLSSFSTFISSSVPRSVLYCKEVCSDLLQT